MLKVKVVSDSLRPHGLYSPWNSLGQNTGVVCHFLLQGIFPTHGSNVHLLQMQVDSLLLSHQGSPTVNYVIQLPSCGQLLATPWTAARQASLLITISQSLHKLVSMELVMPFNHLIVSHCLLLLP